MTVPEFFGCGFLAFGAPLAMFIFTIAHDPVRIIIMLAASFFWLLSLILSATVWFILFPLQSYLWISMIYSVIFQECFRFLIYKILRKTEKGLQEIADNAHVTENKHILAYVSGLGFGVVSGVFAIINVLADSVGPATMGLHGGSDSFFITTAAQTMCMILLHTFWSVIFFDACDKKNILYISYVILSHLIVSSLTLLNQNEHYFYSLFPSYIFTIFSGLLAFKVAGGSSTSFKRCITCK